MDQKKKILLVDDVKLFLKLEETFFKRTGCEILTAESGQQAIDLACDHQPDLILLDYIMPDMMGDEIIKKLKATKATEGIPIMIVSTSADEKDIEKCFQAGAEDYVTKPINAQEVLAKAANILNIPNRVHFRVPIRIEVAGEAQGSSFMVFSRNISQGGILVEFDKSLAAGTMLILILPIQHQGETMRLHGRVVRVDLDQVKEIYLIGIQFLSVSSAQESALSEFIKTHRAMRGSA